jgi:hypothetical protein
MQPWSQPLLWKATSTAVACDPYFGNVVLLMGGEGANNSTGAPGFTDESPAAHGVATVSAPSVIDTSQFKFGTSSIHVANGYVYYPTSNDWNLGSGQFTIECWVRWATDTVAGQTMFLANWFSSTGTLGWNLALSAPLNLTWSVSTLGTDNLVDINAPWSPVANTWYHIAVDYDGAKYRAYINGAMVGSSTTPRTIFNPAQRLGIGSNSQDQFSHAGWLDEIRITKGVARYASDSGFVVPTAAFPRVQC